jgi:hypothetical protein
MNGRANQFVLTLESGGQHGFVKAARHQIIVRRTLTRQDRASGINQRQNYRRVQAFIFGLHVIDDSVEFDVSVVTGNHFDSDPLPEDLARSNSERQLER